MAIDLRVKFRRTARNSQELYASCGLGKTSNAQTFNGGPLTCSAEFDGRRWILEFRAFYLTT